MELAMGTVFSSEQYVVRSNTFCFLTSNLDRTSTLQQAIELRLLCLQI